MAACRGASASVDLGTYVLTEFDAMLQRPEGVTIGQLTKAFGIQPHSARAMISTARRRLGKEIVPARAKPFPFSLTHAIVVPAQAGTQQFVTGLPLGPRFRGATGKLQHGGVIQPERKWR